MCGLTGVLGAAGGGAEAAARMADALAHRGPDSAGTWADAAAGISLGHRRLAVVDLSASGHQPMTSASGRHVIAYNGEIYNHLDLRAELGAQDWRGTSDTETLCAAIDAWGIDEAVARARGMFAFAVWDRQTRTLSLARDRMGEKPLYYGRIGGGAVFAFASELRALEAHPAFEAPIAREELVHFLRHGYFRVGHSVYRGIAEVCPGEIVELPPGAVVPNRRFYRDGAACSVARAGAFEGTDAEAVDRLEALLDAAVAQQMLADVPLGAFLSGGIDSSLVVALMQRRAARPVHTFSIGFKEARFNEAVHAKAIAAHLGTDHTELYVDQRTLLDVVPRLAEIFDAPFGDSSQIPTYLVAQLARKHVTVALSGDGGDELFGGYERYAKGARLWAALARVPHQARRAAAAAVQAVPQSALAAVLSPVRKAALGKEPNGQWAHRMARYMGSAGVDDLHLHLVCKTADPAALVIGGADPPYALRGAVPARGRLGDAGRMMQLDALTYLPGDILTKVDRAAMAVSLETRAPLLDPAVVTFAWSLPERMKIRDGQGKWVLRQVLYRLVPQALVDRPKMGFEVPIGPWLRGPLRDWAEALLDAARLEREGVFAPGPVRALWAAHLSGRAENGATLWHVLMFQAWYAQRREGVALSPPHGH